VLLLVAVEVVLDDVFEACERVGPQVVEDVTDLVERLRAQAIQPLGALPLLGEQARTLEDLEVLADGLLGHLEVPCDFTRSEALVTDQPQDAPAAGIGDSAQDDVRACRSLCNRGLIHGYSPSLKELLVQVAHCSMVAGSGLNLLWVLQGSSGWP
jgi:hypothetical protein